MRDISWLAQELLASQEGFSMELVDTLQETTHVKRACFANASCLFTVVFEHERLNQNAKKKESWKNEQC
jgi:hypothetical protein